MNVFKSYFYFVLFAVYLARSLEIWPETYLYGMHHAIVENYDEIHSLPHVYFLFLIHFFFFIVPGLHTNVKKPIGSMKTENMQHKVLRFLTKP